MLQVLRCGVLALGLFAAGCECAPPDASRFGSDDAIASARCTAQRWHADAVLHSVFAGRALSWLDGVDGSSLPRNSLDNDGRGQAWTVTFTAPSAKCGSQRSLANINFTVEPSGIRQSGESCGLLMIGCGAGLSSPPVDSQVVVPRGWSELSAMADFDAASAVLMVGNLYDCRVVNGSVENRQDWEVRAYWTQPGGVHEGIINYDPSGKVTAVRGPCPFADLSCLGTAP